MSTNYYFKANGRGNIEEGAQIHIGQRASGWKPLFQITEYYQAFEEFIHFYKYHAYELNIVNEFGAQLSWQEFMNEFLTWGADEDAKDRESYTKEDRFGYQWCDAYFS